MTRPAAAPTPGVLAVMDAAQDLLGQMSYSQTANALIAARDDVRELIEAATEYRATVGQAATFIEVRDARKRLFAALAKAGNP